MPFPYIHEKKVIDNALRESVEGGFVSLTSGYTHYEMSKNLATESTEHTELEIKKEKELSGFSELRDKSIETVVLVHGFSVPMFIWETTFRFLSEQGYRVLRYDLFGRGYSDRPKARYDLDFFAQQLYELLNALEITEAVNLFGLSIGGPITATFTAKHPERVKKLALFAPAGGEGIPRSTTTKLMDIPILGELLMGLWGRKTLIDAIAEDFYDPELLAYFTKMYLPQLDYAGFGRAILQTLRNDALRDSSAIYRKVGKLTIPKLLVWGHDDQTVPYAQSSQVVASLPGVRFETIEKSGHIPHYEDADQVNPIILDFLKN